MSNQDTIEKYNKLKNFAIRTFTNKNSSIQNKDIQQIIQHKLNEIKKRTNKFNSKHEFYVHEFMQTVNELIDGSPEQYRKLQVKECKDPKLDCNKQYRNSFLICSNQKCDNTTNKYIEAARTLLHYVLFDIDGTKHQKQTKINENSPEVDKIKFLIKDELKRDETGEFENYIYMVLSIVFTDYQSQFMNYSYFTKDENNSQKHLVDLGTLVLQSMHWNYRYISHYNPLNHLKRFHSTLLSRQYKNTDEVQMKIFLTEYLIQHYEKYFSLNRGTFCDRNILDIIIEMCSLFFSENNRKDNLSKMFFKMSEGNWEKVAIQFHNEFLLFIGATWNQNDPILKQSIVKYSETVLMIIDVIHLSGASVAFYEIYASLHQSITNMFYEINKNGIKNVKFEDCILKHLDQKIKKSTVSTFEQDCNSLGIMLTRNQTNSMFYALNHLHHMKPKKSLTQRKLNQFNNSKKNMSSSNINEYFSNQKLNTMHNRQNEQLYEQSNLEPPKMTNTSHETLYSIPNMNKSSGLDSIEKPTIVQESDFINTSYPISKDNWGDEIETKNAPNNENIDDLNDLGDSNKKPENIPEYQNIDNSADLKQPVPLDQNQVNINAKLDETIIKQSDQNAFGVFGSSTQTNEPIFSSISQSSNIQSSVNPSLDTTTDQSSNIGKSQLLQPPFKIQSIDSSTFINNNKNPINQKQISNTPISNAQQNEFEKKKLLKTNFVQKVDSTKKLPVEQQDGGVK